MSQYLEYVFDIINFWNIDIAFIYKQECIPPALYHKRGLCTGGLCQVGLCPGGISVKGVSVQGVSVQIGFCPGGLFQGDPPVDRHL